MLEDSENRENIKEHIKSPEDKKKEQEKQATDDVAVKRGRHE